MAAVSITPDDLAPFATIPEAKAVEMIADAMAMAALDAPCILEDEFAYEAAAKAIIRGAILRWHEAGSGAFQQQQTGPFGATMDTRTRRDSMFTEAEIDGLKRLCASGVSSGAFDINTVSCGTVHAEVCNLNPLIGGPDSYCSCGADIAGFPLWEV